MENWKLIREILSYFSASRRRWLLPIVIFLIIIGGLMIAGSSASLAPFIYTLF